MIKRFANECNADTYEEDDNLEEVYLNGFFEISSDDVEGYFINVLMEEEYNPKLKIVQGTINGKKLENSDRIFTTYVNNEEVYIKQSDVDEIAHYFGIPHNKKFDKNYFVTIDDAKKYYEENLVIIFYPDEQDEFMEYYQSDDDSQKMTKSGKVDNRSERHAKTREEVLGAALSSLANNYKECINNSGSIEARKIKDCVYLHSNMFWDNNRMPMEQEGIERLISKWINHNGKTSDDKK